MLVCCQTVHYWWRGISALLLNFADVLNMYIIDFCWCSLRLCLCMWVILCRSCWRTLISVLYHYYFALLCAYFWHLESSNKLIAHMWILLIAISWRFTRVCISEFDILLDFVFLPIGLLAIFCTDQSWWNWFPRDSCNVIMDQEH